jgi:hypothetical protein
MIMIYKQSETIFNQKVLACLELRVTQFNREAFELKVTLSAQSLRKVAQISNGFDVQSVELLLN